MGFWERENEILGFESHVGGIEFWGVDEGEEGSRRR